MCGIAGVFFFDGHKKGAEIVKRMTDAMAHRGPDAEGFFSDDSVTLGHRRLAIIDLSENGNQPFPDSTKRYQMIFNGELFNFQDVKATITDHEYKSTSDTEVLIEAFVRRGLDCISQFKGMFAIAIWDTVDKIMYLVRDRMGVKPLYYYIDEKCIVFASEIRAILASNIVARKLNRNVVANYFKYQSVSSPESIIECIHELPAGHFMKVSGDAHEIKRYWDILSAKQVTETDSRIIKNNIHDLLQKSVTQRLISDVPIGAFLSGGIDSSAIVALMSRSSAAKPVTFNISFQEKAFDESSYADLVAAKFNTDHHKIVLQPTIMLDELTNALDAIDTPTGDGINTYIVSKAVKKAGLTVALSGVGGDELFAGYPFFKQYHNLQKQSTLWNVSAGFRKIVAGFAGNGKWNDLLRTPNSDISSVYPILRQIFSPREIKDLTTLKNGHDVVADMLKFRHTELKRFPAFSQVSIAEYFGYTQQTLLKDTDQMSMAVSLEVREPFFDHELVEYVLGISDAIKYPTYPKKLLVESLQDLLPAEIVHRAKQGFTLPWRIWLKNELKSFCESHIYRICERDFINADELKKKWSAFLRDDKSVLWVEIIVFVVLEYWMEKNGVN